MDSTRDVVGIFTGIFTGGAGMPWGARSLFFFFLREGPKFLLFIYLFVYL